MSKNTISIITRTRSIFLQWLLHHLFDHFFFFSDDLFVFTNIGIWYLKLTNLRNYYTCSCQPTAVGCTLSLEYILNYSQYLTLPLLLVSLSMFWWMYLNLKVSRLFTSTHIIYTKVVVYLHYIIEKYLYLKFEWLT